ncbi:transcriptional regulator [Polymorphospora sp. NPDC050346]|uniref:helix-turn-helix domain-containing protein n=1 Tax=Polymorphospora sp. NPDC050346 TaxID=3155780 RepID=UPI0033D96E96
MIHTDPPDMPEDERMTDAEFKVVREYLGVTGDWLAGFLGVTPRTLRHWETGTYLIPDTARLALERLEQEAGEFVGVLVEKLRDARDVAVVTYRTDEDLRAAHPEVDRPASWHRAVIARVAQEVPNLSIVYAPKDDR